MAIIIVRNHGIEVDQVMVDLSSPEYAITWTSQNTLVVTSSPKSDTTIVAWIVMEADGTLFITPRQEIQVQSGVPHNLVPGSKQILGDGTVLVFQSYQVEIQIAGTKTREPDRTQFLNVGYLSGESGNLTGESRDKPNLSDSTAERLEGAEIETGKVPTRSLKGMKESESAGKKKEEQRRRRSTVSLDMDSTQEKSLTQGGTGDKRSSRPVKESLREHIAGTNKVDETLIDTKASQLFAQAAQTSAPPTPPDEEERGTLERESTVRYFHRMYPVHTYPVRVILSAGKIREMQMKDVSQSKGDKPLNVSATRPYVTIIPIFPGTIVAPESLTLDITPKLVEAEFWVTPQTEGKIGQARVEIHYEGKVIDRIATPFQVTRHTLAKISLLCSFLFPLVGPILKYFQMDLESQISKGFPLLRPILETLGNAPQVVGFVIFASLAVLLFLWRRPKEADPITQFLSLGTELESAPKPSAVSTRERQEPTQAQRTQAETWCELAAQYASQGKATEALDLYEKALPIYRKLGIRYEVGVMLGNLGRLLCEKKDFDRALEFWAEEQSIWIQLGREQERGRCLSSLGMLYQLRQQYDKAILFLKEAAEVGKFLGDKKGQIISLQKLAETYRINKNFEEAMHVCRQMEEILTEYDKSERAFVYHTKGLLLFDALNYDDAIDYFQDAVALYESIESPICMTEGVFYLGLCYRAKRESKVALSYFRRAYEMYMKEASQESQKWLNQASNYIQELEQGEP
jgi:tetratricopeptide (TPR) repeat protein